MTQRSKWLLAGILIVTGVVYLRCLGNAFVYDDLWLIRLNPYIKQWSFLWLSLARDSWWFRDPGHLPQSSYYRPLQDIWLGLNYHLFGFNPAGWHAMTIALHLVTVCLVFRVALLILSDDSAALIATLLFALIPVHAEAVVWASAIPLPMSAMFIFAAFYFFLKRRADPRLNWTLSLFFVALALLSHEGAVIFPVLAAIYVFLLESPVSNNSPNSGRPKASFATELRRTAISVAPFVVEVVVFLGIRTLIIGGLTYRHGQTIYATPGVVITTIPYDVARFAELLLLPWKASVAHGVHFVTDPSSVQFWGPLLGIVLLAGIAVWTPHRQRLLVLFCVLWFLVALAPEMNLMLGSPSTFVQDRYLYLASFGWCLLLGSWAAIVATQGYLARNLAYGAVGALAISYAVTLFNVQAEWRDDLTYFSRAVADAPQAAYTHHGLGEAFAARNRLPDALREFNIAVRMNPQMSDWLFDRGVIEAHLGNYQDAVRDMSSAVTLDPERPPRNYASLANYADAAGNTELSEAALKQAESMQGGEKIAETTRAQILLRHGDFQAASRIAEEQLKKYPDDALLWSILGAARTAAGDYQGALFAYKEMALLAPDFSAPYFLSAQILHAMHRDDEALAKCRIALRLNPGDPATLALLAQIQH